VQSQQTLDLSQLAIWCRAASQLIIAALQLRWEGTWHRRYKRPIKTLNSPLDLPGRFDRQVVVPNPDVVGREQILKLRVRKVPLAPDINLKTIARGTPGFSGADLMNLVNEAALTAARRNKRMVTQAEFEEAKDKVMMGAERKSLVMAEEEKLLSARLWRGRTRHRRPQRRRH